MESGIVITQSKIYYDIMYSAAVLEAEYRSVELTKDTP